MVTVYAWSIENFKRSKEEVDYLMDMAVEKVNFLLSKMEIIEKHQVCIRVLGNLQLLPLEVQKSFAKITNATKNNNRVTLNVCFSYTAQEEISNSMKLLGQAVQDKTIYSSDITEDLFEKSLYLEKPVDLLIRTSGETRFSDFLLWQNSFACVVFLNVLWPDFSYWHLYWAIILFQKNHPILLERREAHLNYKTTKQLQFDQTCGERIVGRDTRVDNYLESLKESQSQYIAELLSN
jgi:ditrans,polycis-polyprenyl diphosphate synthase